MKKMLVFMLSLVLLLSLCPAALADVIAMPQDSFFEKHRDECRHENRGYYTNGSDGYVVGMNAPEGSSKVVFPNGTHFVVSWTYGEGEERWGFMEYDSETLEQSYGDASCWVKMSDMLSDYDSESFMAEHEAELVEESAQVVIPDYQTYMICWAYPSSDTVKFTIGGHANTIDFHQTYTDTQGRKWGYCGYWRGHRNFWVCLDDPFNQQLSPGEEYVDVLSQLIPAADEAAMEAALKGEKASNRALMFGAVGVVAIAAALLAYVLKKKKA